MDKKACQRFGEMLVLRHYGELEGGEAAELDAHLRACESCRAEREELERTLRAIPPSEPSEARVNEAVRGVMERIAPKERPAWRWLAPGAAAAAACAIVLMLVLSEDPSRQAPPAHSPLVAEADLELLANYELLSEMEVLEDLEIAEMLEDL